MAGNPNFRISDFFEHADAFAFAGGKLSEPYYETFLGKIWVLQGDLIEQRDIANILQGAACGGIAYTVLDFHRKRFVVPRGGTWFTDADHLNPDSPLAWYIIQRSNDLRVAPDPLHPIQGNRGSFAATIQAYRSDANLPERRARTTKTIQALLEVFNRDKPEDRKPMPLCAFGPGQFPLPPDWRGPRERYPEFVIAYGLDLSPLKPLGYKENLLRIYIYNPRWPADPVNYTMAQYVELARVLDVYYTGSLLADPIEITIIEENEILGDGRIARGTGGPFYQLLEVPYSEPADPPPVGLVLTEDFALNLETSQLRVRAGETIRASYAVKNEGGRDVRNAYLGVEFSQPARGFVPEVRPPAPPNFTPPLPFGIWRTVPADARVVRAGPRMEDANIQFTAQVPMLVWPCAIIGPFHQQQRATPVRDPEGVLRGGYAVRRFLVPTDNAKNPIVKDLVKVDINATVQVAVDAVSVPSVVADDNGRLHVFYVSTRGTVRVASQTLGSRRFDPPISLGSPRNIAVDENVLIAPLNVAGRLEIYLRLGADIYFRRQLVAGSPVDEPGPPAPFAIPWPAAPLPGQFTPWRSIPLELRPWDFSGLPRGRLFTAGPPAPYHDPERRIVRIFFRVEGGDIVFVERPADNMAELAFSEPEMFVPSRMANGNPVIDARGRDGRGTFPRVLWPEVDGVEEHFRYPTQVIFRGGHTEQEVVPVLNEQGQVVNVLVPVERLRHTFEHRKVDPGRPPLWYPFEFVSEIDKGVVVADLSGDYDPVVLSVRGGDAVRTVVWFVNHRGSLQFLRSRVPSGDYFKEWDSSGDLLSGVQPRLVTAANDDLRGEVLAIRQDGWVAGFVQRSLAEVATWDRRADFEGGWPTTVGGQVRVGRYSAALSFNKLVYLVATDVSDGNLYARHQVLPGVW